MPLKVLVSVPARMLLRTAAFLTLAGGAVASAQTVTPKDPVTLLAEGDRLFSASSFDSARTAFEQALQLARGATAKEPASEARALRGTGRVLLELGRADSAAQRFRAALELEPAADRLARAVTLAFIAEALVDPELDSLEAAQTIVDQAMALAPAEGTERADVLRVRGALQLVKREVDSAIITLQEAAGASKTAPVQLRAAILNTLARAYLARTGGESEAETALRVAESIQDTSRATVTVATTLMLLARAIEPLDQEGARTYFDRAARKHDAIRNRLAANTDRVTYVERARETYELWAWAWAVGLRRSPNGLAAAERGRMQVLLQLVDNKTAEEDRERLDDLTEAGRTLVRTLKSENAVAALYYLQTERGLLTWYVPQDGEIRPHPNPRVRADSILRLIYAVHRSVGTDSLRTRMAPEGTDPTDSWRLPRVSGRAAPLADAETALRALSEILLPAYAIEDLRARGGNGAEVLIVPYGIIGLVPFAALPLPGDSLPLGIRFALRYTPSLSALARIRERDANPRYRRRPDQNLNLVIGNPRMPAVPGPDSTPLPPLRFAEEEAVAIAQLLGTEAFTGSSEEATEDYVRRALSRTFLVHLATHGYAVARPTRVRDSYLALGEGGNNDGLLTLGELMDSVDVRADLVVLSACQTGLGYATSAEGVIGFPRGFIQQGANSVLVSLWSVNDQATSYFMQQFYKYWLGRDGSTEHPKAEALRLAQADTRRQARWRNMRYWAAFQLVGGS